MRKGIVVGGLAAVAIAGAETAAHGLAPAMALTFGGGSVGLEPSGYYSTNNSFVSFRRDDDATYTAYAVLPVRCGPRSASLAIDGPVSGDGTVEVEEVTSIGLRTTGRTTGRVKLSGNLSAVGGSGTLTVTGAKLRRIGRRDLKCTRPQTKWVVTPGVETLPGRAAKVLPATRFYGLTSGRGDASPLSPIIVRSNGEGNGLRNILIDVAVPCKTGSRTAYGNTLGPVRLDKTGAFVLRDDEVTITGQATPGGLAGTLRARVDNCDTGSLRWAVTPPATNG